MEYGVWRRGTEAYPPQLDTIHAPPHALHALGDRRVVDAPCVAVVGTRRPTPYGVRVAKQLAGALARQGICVVSGMATGIDGVAHQEALDVGGRTAAVLGAGIDEIYPPRHRKLYQDISRSGVVVSEYGPGTKPFRGCFPRRNRIIAGLASVTIVVEAGEKSGALITASYAAEFGRTVAAVPGPIESPQSHGPNHLLRDGANVIASVDDALLLLGLTHTAPARDPSFASGDEAAVWDAVTPGASADDVIARTGLPPDRCLAAITSLELQGLVACLHTGEIRRR